MNELETIIFEVHQHIVHGKELSPDITVNVRQYTKIEISYFNYKVLLKEQCLVIQYNEYKHRYENYVTEKDVHFEQSLMYDVLCDVSTMNRMVDIRDWYGFISIKNDEFMHEFNESE